jgi:hypothetical protein
LRGKAGTAALILFGYRRAECGRGGGRRDGGRGGRCWGGRCLPFPAGVLWGGGRRGSRVVAQAVAAQAGGRLTFPVVGCWRRAICGSEAGKEKRPHWGTGGRWVVWFILLFMQGLLCQRCLRLRRRFPVSFLCSRGRYYHSCRTLCDNRSAGYGRHRRGRRSGCPCV